MKPVAPPNYTQIPNEFLDRMDEFTPAEFKVLMALCRETFGWHKRDTVISLGQLEKVTGLARTTVSQALTSLDKDKNLLERKKVGIVGRQTVCYRLLVVADQSDNPTSTINGLVGLLDQSDNHPGTSSLIGPPLVVLSDPPPLKKDLKKLKEKAAAAAAVFGAILSPTDALRLVETHPGCIDHAEALVREASKPKINDPAGMLVHLVTTGWIPPAVTSNGHGPADEEDMTGYLGGYCPTCAAITFGSCGHDEQPQASARPRRRGRQPA